MRCLALTLLLITTTSCRRSGDACSTRQGGVGQCDPGYSCAFDSACDQPECFGTCVPSCRDGGCVDGCTCTNAPFGTNLCLGNRDAGVHACDWPVER